MYPAYRLWLDTYDMLSEFQRAGGTEKVIIIGKAADYAGNF